MKKLKEKSLKIGKWYRIEPLQNDGSRKWRRDKSSLLTGRIYMTLRISDNDKYDDTTFELIYHPNRIWVYFNEDQETQFKFGK